MVLNLCIRGHCGCHCVLQLMRGPSPQMAVPVLASSSPLLGLRARVFLWPSLECSQRQSILKGSPATRFPVAQSRVF